MTGGTVAELGDGRLLIELGFRDREGLIAAYLIPGPEGWTIVETGPGATRTSLAAGVHRAGADPSEVSRIFVTHIHLDHSGGLAAAAESFPNARLFAHVDGLPHLIDPTRLVASARRAWGGASDELFGPTGPVPADRLVALRGGERFPIAGGDLRVVATPGHARHHLSYFDEPTGGLYVGDSAGIRLSPGAEARPAVPPPDLDIDLLLRSVEAMRTCAPRTLRYAHFGEYPDAGSALPAYADTVLRWKEVALSMAREHPDAESIAASLRASTPIDPDSMGGPDATEMVSGTEMAAAGFLRYFRRTGQIPE